MEYETGNGYVNISWTEPESDGNATILHYNIYRGTNSGEEVLYKVLDGETYYYNDTEVLNGQTYFYYVKAENIAGESGPSETVMATPQISPWPVFQNNFRHTGLSPHDTSRVNNSVKWKYTALDDIYSSTAIGPDGTIYIGSDDNRLYALRRNGSLLWYFPTSGDVQSTPAIGPNGTIYFGSNDNYLYALYPNGTLLWKYQTGDDVITSPAVGLDGTIYFGSKDSKVYALYPNGTKRWSYTTGGWVTASPAIDSHGMIYFGSEDSKLYVFYENGTLAWDHTTGGSIRSAPTVGIDGTIYFGSADKKLYSINPGGTLRWTYLTGNNIASSPAIAPDGTIIFGSDDHYLYALYPNGTKRWSYITGDKVLSSPAISYDGTIYFGSYDNVIYALEMNGTLKWTYTTGDMVHSSPAIGQDGTVYIGSLDNTFYAFGPRISMPPRYLNTTAGSGYIDISWEEPAYDGGSEVLKYRIYRKEGEAGWEMLEELNSTEPSYNDTSVSDNEVYYYRITALNLVGESDPSDMIKGDRVSPWFGGDLSDMSGTTGDPFNFITEAFDNVLLKNVHVEYWYGTGTHNNITLEEDTYHSTEIDLPDNSTDPLRYFFSACDFSGNWVASGVTMISISDNDDPVFYTDDTPSSATTGENLVFSIETYDNVGIQTISVEYWYGTGTSTNSTMTGSGTYTLTITIPSDSNLTLHYIFHASDTSANWVHSDEKTVTVIDNDRPELVVDSTPTSGTTGDPFTFNVTFDDNIEVQGTTVEYWYTGGTHTTVSLILNSTYQYTMDIQSNSTSSLHYTFNATDTSGNHLETSEKVVTISDNDLPYFHNDRTDTQGTTGDQFKFKIEAFDNIGVSTVTVEYWFGSGTHTNTSMTGTGPYSTTMTIPSDETESLNYIFHASDTSGNWHLTSSRSVSILDNDIPTIKTDTTPSSGTTGESIEFNVTVTDNVKVSTVTVEYWFGSGTHTNSSMSGSSYYEFTIRLPSDSISTLHYIFHASDETGNWGTSAEKDVAVLDNDLPILGSDLTPDEATTGDEFTFQTEASDNIGIEIVTVEYWFGTGAHTNSTTDLISTHYLLTVTVPHTLSLMHYLFHISDDSGNWNLSGAVDVPVLDNDRPFLVEDRSPTKGTTGDPFTFNITIGDNIKFNTATVEYWYGTGLHRNETMNGEGPFILQIVLPLDSLDSMHYIFHMNDTSKNWNQTDENSVEISDNDMPYFATETTPSWATTGDSLTFSVSVLDNIGVQIVTVEYWFGSESKTNVSMTPGIGYSYTVPIPENSLSLLHYIYHACDLSGNWNLSCIKDIEVLDNDKPSIGDDLSDNSATTGDPYRFMMEASDNIGIEVVYVEYWFGDGEIMNENLTGSGTYFTTITASENSTSSLHYIFHVLDTSDNEMTTNERTVPVLDNDRPQMVDDGTGSIATTGDPFEFLINVTDNIGIDGVWVRYWFGDGTKTNISLSTKGDLSYFEVIDVPTDSLDTLHYTFHIRDENENWNSIKVKDVEVKDNDAPSIEDVQFPDEAGTGDYFKIDIEADDNIDILEVRIEYWFGTNDHESVSTAEYHGIYSNEIFASLNSLDQLHFIVAVKDTSENTLSSDVYDIDVIDTKFPSIEPIDDLVKFVGETLNITVEATDNIGITTYSWKDAPFEAEGASLNGILSETGKYKIEVTVDDDEGNSVSTIFNLTVHPEDLDTDSDGMPDLYEINNDLDPYDGNDAYQDPDQDGKNNYKEFQNGTDPNDDDTDKDGMPDGWELDHGLNALNQSASNDEDGDGLTDLEEYTGGTDPTVSDIEAEGEKTSWLPIILGIVGAILLISLIAGAFMLIRRRRLMKLMGTGEGGMKEIFISYAHQDQKIAVNVCNRLEKNGYRCWMAPRDVTPGMNWGKAIIGAINASKLMVLVFSSRSNQSEQVLREVERAVSKKVPIIPFRIENIMPSEEFEYFISSAHWLDAYTPPLERHLGTLLMSVESVLGKKEKIPPKEFGPDERATGAFPAKGASDDIPPPGLPPARTPQVEFIKDQSQLTGKKRAGLPTRTVGSGYSEYIPPPGKNRL